MLSIIYGMSSEGGKEWDYKILDPAAEKWAGSFDPEVIIPLPVSDGKIIRNSLRSIIQPSSHSGENFRFNWILGQINLCHQVGMWRKQLVTTILYALGRPIQIGRKNATKSEFWTTCDDVFYVFSQIRKKFMGAAVGVALGRSYKTKKTMRH